VSIPPELASRPVVEKLRAFNPRAVTAATDFRGQLTLTVPPELVRDVAEFLRDTPDFAFHLLTDITAVDRYPVEPRFEIFYFLRSMRTGERLRLKAPVSGGEPRIESVVGLWPAADILECEVFDLFGVHFRGHPRLRRVLMPDDWQGHPLRKDYPVEGYR
jgi:NADH-quinone oxidoreductase subunit C